MIVLDASILIPLLRGDEDVTAAAAGWRAEGEVLATTSMAMAETLRGEADVARRFAYARRRLQPLVQIPFGPSAAVRFARMMSALDRAGTPAPVVDAMIAAATLEAGGALATRDLAGFRNIPGLEILEP